MRLDRKKLVLAMMDADLNTKVVAEKAKLSRVTISAVKNGRSCNESTAIKIAQALGVDVDELLETK